jgi:methanogenic corrinoid protein MtbC1
MRTASGYRLYGAHDIAQVREMRRLCDGGMAAAEAAKLLSRSNVPSTDEPRAPVDPYAASLDAVLDAIVRFDDVELELQLRKAMFLGTATAILDHVVAPALREVGRRWREGELSIAHEHLASQRLGTVMRDLARLAPRADAHETVLLASFADDDHELALLDVATRFGVEGLRPIVLGARTPPDAIRAAVDGFSPALVGLSVTLTPNPTRARELVDAYAAACGSVPWVVGGAGVPPIAAMIRARGGSVVEGSSSPEYAAEFRAVARAALKRASLRSNFSSRRQAS